MPHRNAFRLVLTVALHFGPMGITMKNIPRTGQSAEERITVDASNRIVFADDRMPAVLATPWLVAHLEYAARKAIAPVFFRK